MNAQAVAPVVDQTPMPAATGSITQSVPLGDRPYSTPYYSVGKEICQNLYMEIAQAATAKASYYYLKIPGLRRYTQTSIGTANSGACRALFTTSSGRTFQVTGNEVREVLVTGTRVLIGTLSTYTGTVQMAENGSLVMVVDGANGWILRLADNNWTKITDEYFPGNDSGTLAPTHVTYLDTYFIVNNRNTNEYYYSTSYYSREHDDTTTPYDPAEPNGYWTPINSGKKIGKPDNISALINCNNYLWLFGYNSSEVHYDTGDYNGQLFARYQGAIINVGCNAPYSVAVYNNNVFWLATDNTGTLGVYTNDGLVPVRISTRGIEQLVETMGVWTDCTCYCYAQSGHAYYVMQFPQADKTLVYDLVTSAWHERTSLDKATGLLHRWHGMYATSNHDQIIMGDLGTSELYVLDPKYYVNDTPLRDEVNYIRCVKTLPINFANGANVRYNWIQVMCSQGQGLITNTAAGVGIDPTLQVSWSDDSGQTYRNERQAPIGRQGQYAKRTLVLGCGMGRNRVWRIALTDPINFVLVGVLVNGIPARF